MLEYEGKLLKIYEDAYGDMKSEYMTIQEIIEMYEFTVDEIKKIVTDLNETFENK